MISLGNLVNCAAIILGSLIGFFIGHKFKEDMKNILLMMDVLEDDYLGGHGTRGYGRIKFKNLSHWSNCCQFPLMNTLISFG